MQVTTNIMEDIRDSEILVCTHCNQTKKRIRVGKRPESKETKFVGEDGLEWNGRNCPACVVDKSRLRKQLKKKLKGNFGDTLIETVRELSEKKK